jgi:SAM-dependent methyltransferase
VLDLLDSVHLARPAVRAYELALATKARGASRRAVQGADGLPLPPARLRAQVGPLHADADFFLRSGRQHAELIQELLRDAGTDISKIGALLDWGCGCGRVLRHWSRLATTRVNGCDIDPRMIEWCAANLPFADVTVTGLEPPLPYADSSLALVYAFSVFTHLPAELQHTWIAESRRVLEPGGYLLLSTLGERYASLDRLTEEERERFARGEVVVLYAGSPGTSLCSAYHPPHYVHGTLAQGFDVVAFRPEGDEGGHDIHLLRKQ